MQWVIANKRMLLSATLVCGALWFVSMGVFIRRMERYEHVTHPHEDILQRYDVTIRPTTTVHHRYWGISTYTEEGPYRIYIVRHFSEDCPFDTLQLKSIVVQIDNGEEEELLDGEALKIDIKEFSYMQGRREGLVEMKSKIIDYLCDEQLPLDFGVHAQCDVLIEGMLTGADVEDKSITLNRRFHRESDFKIVPFVVVLRSL